MRVNCAKRIGSISSIILLLAAIQIIIVDCTNFAEAEDSVASISETNMAVNGSDPDRVEAASGSNRFVVWRDDTPGNNDILFRRSTDNGATWQAVKNLSNNPGQSLDPKIAVSGSNVYVVWEQDNADFDLGEVFIRRSTDNGATWKSVKNLSNQGSAGSPQIAVAESNVYVVWHAGFDADIFFRRSTDSGAIWNSVKNISNNAGDSFVPQIAV